MWRDDKQLQLPSIKHQCFRLDQYKWVKLDFFPCFRSLGENPHRPRGHFSSFAEPLIRAPGIFAAANNNCTSGFQEEDDAGKRLTQKRTSSYRCCHAGTVKTAWQNPATQKLVGQKGENLNISGVHQTILQSLDRNYSTTISRRRNYQCEYANADWFHGPIWAKKQCGKDVELKKGGKIRKLERPGYEPRGGEVNRRSVNWRQLP